jgi:hypothetical protein
VSGSDFTGASNPSGVLTSLPSNPYSLISAGIYAPGAVSNDVTCAPGVVTNDFATCFPAATSIPLPPCEDDGEPSYPDMPVTCRPKLHW